jgi:DNA-binding transcriptional regulator YbjK
LAIIALLTAIHHLVTAPGVEAVRATGIRHSIGVRLPFVTLFTDLDDLISAEGRNPRFELAIVRAAVTVSSIAVVALLSRIQSAVAAEGVETRL